MTPAGSEPPAFGTQPDLPSEWEQVAGGVVRIRAHNPGPMTLEGTNTWLLHGPGESSAVVVDPGPALAGHSQTIQSILTERGLGVELVLLTHSHPDHSDLARVFAADVEAPLRAADPRWCSASALSENESLLVAGLHVEVITTPGHTSDSVSFAVPGYLVTGDTVLGRGTTVVAHPDGRLSDYLGSLARLRIRAEVDDVVAILPGHGPVIHDPIARLDHYLAHRRERLEAVAGVISTSGVDLAALSEVDLDALVDEVVATVYHDVPRSLWPAAALSVRAQVLYLVEAGSSR